MAFGDFEEPLALITKRTLRGFAEDSNGLYHHGLAARSMHGLILARNKLRFPNELRGSIHVDSRARILGVEADAFDAIVAHVADMNKLYSNIGAGSLNFMKAYVVALREDAESKEDAASAGDFVDEATDLA